MEKRTRGIIGTLALSLMGMVGVAGVKIAFGNLTDNLSFLADGIHSMFDALATGLGIITVLFSTKPPDADHPYGHRKFETLGAVLLAILLSFAAYQVGVLAYQRFRDPHSFPNYSAVGFLILLVGMGVSFAISRFEKKRAKKYQSHYLEVDAVHNLSDFWTAFAVLASLASARFHIPYIDAVAASVITIYLVILSIKLILSNLDPLVDKSVVDPEQVKKIVSSIEGVLHCHQIRSRGAPDHYFLDLNIHLPGHITLEKAHDITHLVESRLKAVFPGLKDVVIHTEPHGHPPCTKD